MTRDVARRVRSGAIKAAIFDCYGTLVDWIPSIRQFLKTYAEKHFSQHILEQLRCNSHDDPSGINTSELLKTYDKVRRQMQIDHPTALYPQILSRSLGAFVKEFQAPPILDECDRFGEQPRAWPAYPDSRPFLTRLREKNIVTAVISNIDNRSFQYTSAQVLHFKFDEVMTAQDLRTYKPDPKFLISMTRKLSEERNIKNHETVLIAQSLYADHRPAQDLFPEILRIHVDRPNSVLGLKIENPPDVDLRRTSLKEIEQILFD